MLIDDVADFSNLMLAYHACARGKRRTTGYRKTVAGRAERLLQVREALLSKTFQWGEYREFTVTDPKERLIMAAPFMDRVVHHSIHRAIEPIYDREMSESVFACRHGKGNRYAALALLNRLREIGPRRFTIKLDVSKYFASIDHEVLAAKLFPLLPDRSLDWLIRSLLQSYPDYSVAGRGIPIGNLTSQLFANYYLVSADRIALAALSARGAGKTAYFRYMDDLVLVGSKKGVVLDAAWAVVNHVEQELRLQMHFQKRIPLGAAPVPFLGYVLDHSGCRILARNRRRHRAALAKLVRKGERDSLIEQVRTSFDAWKTLEEAPSVA